MEVLTRKEKDTVIVNVRGRMGELSSPDFEKKIEELIANGERKFIIDFGELEYISSAGLRSLLAVAKNLKQKNGLIYLTTLKGKVRDVFKISEFTSIFSIFKSVEAALTKISSH